jgi:RNA polymerase subunit RPABC4/transcription elongation factor Spt4
MGESITAPMALNLENVPGKEKKKLGLNQYLGLICGFFMALVILVSGVYTILSCFSMLVIGAVLYLIPHFMKVKDIKVMIAHGAIFMVVAILIGGLYSSPAYVNQHDSFTDSGSFSSCTYTVEDYGYDIQVSYSDSVSVHEPRIQLMGVERVGYNSVYGVRDGTEIIKPYEDDGSVAKFRVETDDGLYAMFFYMENTSDGSMADGSRSISFFLHDKTSDSVMNSAVWSGTAYFLAMCMAMYFMILFFSHAIRSSADKSRKKMEAQGRLYPVGYGRCKKCNAIVLPGEVTCRKCGTYIDVPDEMKPEKKDFFVCSDCGAEVEEGSDVCPKCGAEFDEGIEVEVERADGTVKTSEMTECGNCGATVPPGICPKCGRKTDE